MPKSHRIHNMTCALMAASGNRTYKPMTLEEAINKYPSGYRRPHPLIEAARKNDKEAMTVLLKEFRTGYDINKPCPDFYFTAFHRAVEHEDNVILKMLLENKQLDPWARTLPPDGHYTPFLWAIAKGNAEAVKLILEHKFKKKLKPQLHKKIGKMNALHIACDHSCGTWTNQDHKMLELLLPYTKTCINKRDKEGQTPLDYILVAKGWSDDGAGYDKAKELLEKHGAKCT